MHISNVLRQRLSPKGADLFTSTAIILSGLLVIALVIGYSSPPGQAAPTTKKWTTDTDFSEWSHAGTVASTDTLTLSCPDPTLGCTGFAQITYIPVPGTQQNWITTTIQVSPNGHTFLIEYSPDTTCADSFATDITRLSDSEGVCLRVSFNVSPQEAPVTLPFMDEIELTYDTSTGVGCNTNQAPLHDPLNGIRFEKDAKILTNSPTTNFGATLDGALGNEDGVPTLDESNEAYTLAYFPVSGIPSDASVITLTIPLWQQDSSIPPFGTQLAISLNALADPFDETTVTWDTKPAEVSGSTYVMNQALTTAFLPPKSQVDGPFLLTFDITQLVKDMQTSVIPNHGIVLKAIATYFGTGASYTAEFETKENTTSNNQPVITYERYTWVPGSGPDPNPSSCPPPITPSPPPVSPPPSDAPSPPPSDTPTDTPSDNPTPDPGPTTSDPGTASPLPPEG